MRGQIRATLDLGGAKHAGQRSFPLSAKPRPPEAGAQVRILPGALPAREKTSGPPAAAATGGLFVSVGVLGAGARLMIAWLVAASRWMAWPSMVTRRVTRRVGWW